MVALAEKFCQKDFNAKVTHLSDMFGSLNTCPKVVHYYGETLVPTNENSWMIDTYGSADLPQLPHYVTEEFWDMAAEATNHITFGSFKKIYPKNSANIHFWASMYKVYPTVSKFVIQNLIPFPTTWLCETGFSAKCVLKTKHRNRLEVEHDLRLCLSKVTPRLHRLTDGKQAQLSH
ncbi:SCAN domain-containing protein 3-like [Clavelina lepadiformis]|uniref:SCAN domain-containing protein 3-like n=1 Tax=Clavelina lepadiformis TaxID=159417 RepID=UPI0040416623